MKNIVAALVFAVAVPLAAQADTVVPPNVPANIAVPAGFKPFLVAHAIGTQSYICKFPGTDNPWIAAGPQATLFDERNEQILTHFFSSPNQYVNEVAFPTWEDSRDSSTIWAGNAVGSSDPAFVDPNAVPWLRLQVMSAQQGPAGGDRLTNAAYIQRVNTVEGKAPGTGCAVPSDLFRRVFVPYEADYYFYK